MQDIQQWLQLATTPGASVNVRNRLLDAADGDADRALNDDGLNLTSSITRWRHRAKAQDVSKELRWLDGEGCTLICRGSVSYPTFLAHIPDPPVAFFLKGRVDTLARPGVSMVGSRRPSPQGRRRALMFGRDIALGGHTVVSGLALGIDGDCHRGALQAAASTQRPTTVAVMATGPDMIYPRRHVRLAAEIAENGALITEYGCGVKPLGFHFPHRNRIVSGLTSVTLVIEAAIKSGSLITARLAAEQGRDVFAVPGPPESAVSAGCHELIRSGAGLTQTPEQFLSDIGAESGLIDNSVSSSGITSAKALVLSDIEGGEAVLTAMGYEPTALDYIVLNSGLTADRVCSILSRLELVGLATAIDGGRYCRQS